MVFDYVEYVINNKRKLNGKEISKEINNWIDIIFGVKQLPKSEKIKDEKLTQAKESDETDSTRKTDVRKPDGEAESLKKVPVKKD